MMNEKRAYCRYFQGPADDSGVEALRIYLPVQHGYIRYNLIHTVIPHTQCDTWRLGPVYHCSDDLTDDLLLTRPMAEWEMAIRLAGRVDFIGGAAHGDEVFSRFSLWIDGEERPLHTLCEPTSFETLVAEVESTGYDPNAPTVPVLAHSKTITASGDAIRVDQQVRWLTDVPLESSYMAMMPPFKSLTDRYRFEDEAYRAITLRTISAKGRFSSLSLQGEDGFTFTMQVPRYLCDGEENAALITDNGGDEYHKMYFILQHAGAAHTGECWETTTVYRIER